MYYKKHCREGRAWKPTSKSIICNLNCLPMGTIYSVIKLSYCIALNKFEGAEC